MQLAWDLRSVKGEHYYRVLWKHARALFEIDLDKLRTFFQGMDARGYGPDWDDNEWGYREKIEAVRKTAEEKWP